ncbi:uncharacterized protein LOC120202539 [Hibiscus syriacus]|uniref:uncharacterized protein LOC120202539 n=1 Tax=Hibiscus syriacus TaxID=106335 RepID=UPI00192473B6|nr:uncharacterized protein LOC120202539 [Hibiscus syriacus]
MHCYACFWNHHLFTSCRFKKVLEDSLLRKREGSNLVEGIISLTDIFRFSYLVRTYPRKDYQSLILRYLTRSSNENSFTVSYLKNKCGLSLESALKATRYVHFESPEKPDSVLAVLKNHGFSKPQITRLIKGRPAVLTSNVEKTILPKLEFLISKGVSNPDLAHILSHNPTFLFSSLENNIRPSYNFLSTVLKSSEKIILAECNIASTFCSQPTTFFRSPRKFKDMVKETKEMGFTPSKPLFMEALYAMSSTSKPTWKRKIDFFKKFGWSEEEVFEAFRRYPSFISFSEYRYMVMIDFLVNKMGFPSSVFVKPP